MRRPPVMCVPASAALAWLGSAGHAATAGGG